MCKLEPEEWGTYPQCSHSSYFNSSPPSLPLFSPLFFLSDSFDYLNILLVWVSVPASSTFWTGCVSRPTPQPPLGSPRRPLWPGSLWSMSWPGASVGSQLPDRWCEGLWRGFVSCCENCFNALVRRRGWLRHRRLGFLCSCWITSLVGQHWETPGELCYSKVTFGPWPGPKTCCYLPQHFDLHLYKKNILLLSVRALMDNMSITSLSMWDNIDTVIDIESKIDSIMWNEMRMERGCLRMVW